MKKTLDVREFERITYNPDYKDIDGYKYIDKKIFDELTRFIREFIGAEDEDNVFEFLRVESKRHIGDFVSIKNYVGVIQLKGGFQIQVLPKIDFTCDDDDIEKTKRAFIKMLRSMKDFPGKTFNEADIKVDKMNLYELYINMYLQEVRHLVKKGIKSAYLLNEDNQKFFKGKLLIGQQIKVNNSHKERFYVAFDEFNPNRSENRLIKSTLLKLQRITGSAENSKEIKQLLTAFELVNPSDNYDKDFSKVIIDRNTKDYEMLMRWSKVFLYNKSFATFTGNTNSRALLFPMESVYESYVAQQMKKVFCPTGWEVKCQDKKHYLFTEPEKQFALRPDIVMNKDGRTIVMDTKWKRLTDDVRMNYGISQADMYQMYAYAKKYGDSDVWLLYPVNNDVRGKDTICFRDDDVKVSVFFVDVDPDRIKGNLTDLKNMIN